MRILDRLALAAWGAAAFAAQSPQAAGVVQAIRVHGGSPDDQAFARAALGLKEGGALDATALGNALAAVRATDRFRTVQAEPPGAAGLLELRLEPWPRLRAWTWEGDALPRNLAKTLFPELRKGLALGARRLETWRVVAERRIRMAGFPVAALEVRRTAQDAELVFRVRLGPPALIRALRVEGDPFPYTPQQILAWSGLQPGRSHWNADARHQVLTQLRKRCIRDGRYQGQVALAWKDTEGALVISLAPGPVVRLESEGEGLGWTSLGDLVPLARAERWGPELLDEGERRILRHLRSRGYLDARVSYRRKVLRGPEERPLEICYVYRIEAGRQIRLGALRFERNQDVKESTLQDAVSLPRRWGLFGAPLGTPDLLGELEERTKGAYYSRGYADVALRRRLEPQGEAHALVFQIREGSQKLVKSAVLRLPEGDAWRTWDLGRALLRILGHQPQPLGPPDPLRLRFRGDRPGQQGVEGVLERLQPSGFRLTLSQPVPFVKSDLALCLAELRTRAQGLGVRRPSEQVRLDGAEDASELVIELPEQAFTLVRRVTVVGADDSRAEAVLREIPGLLGTPYDPARLGQLQAHLGNLRAFQRVDIQSLAESGENPSDGAWTDGDLLLRLEERAPWVLHSGFGYDKNLGYHLAAGVQRLNFQGMGRTLDLGFRAGDATLKAPALRKLFPTGEFTRSVDNYTLGYSDPWFPSGWIPGLPDRAQYRVEASYIQEQKTSYLIRRRRVVNDLEWRPTDQLGIQVGHRYERSESRYVDLIDFNNPLYEKFKKYEDILLNQANLNTATRSPARAVVSAPFVQWYRDTRDSRIDPTQGAYTVLRTEFANQLFGTSPNTSFVRLDARQQWTWPVGYRASAGVVSLGLRVGMLYPTGSSDPSLPTDKRLNLPLSERYFGGGPGSHRGVEPDALGPRTSIPRLVRNSEGLYQPVIAPGSGDPPPLIFDYIPMGGEGLALINLEYRFPLLGQSIWGEIFVDSGQVYGRIKDTRKDPGSPPFPPFITALGAGLIFKIGLPIKIEYGADWRRILGRPRSREDRLSQLKSLLVSAGFTF